MFKILLNREGRAFIKLYFCMNTFIIFYHLSCITLDVDCIIYVTQYWTIELYVESTYEFTIVITILYLM